MSTQLEFFASCPLGINDLLAKELESFGATDLKESAAGVSFKGTLETAYRACLWSRVASRVHLHLATFPVITEDDLYKGVKAVAWEDHLFPDRTFAIQTSGKTTTVTHTHYASLKAKDAVVDRFRELTGERPSVQVRQPDARIHIHLARDKGTVSLDLSGESLNKRGYRLDMGEAPLKENLAAAILLRAGWPAIAAEDGPFVDPMCGSGTLLVEAALMAGDVAPGIFRTVWGFTGWKKHESGMWTNLQVEARYRMKEGGGRFPVMVGYDAERSAIRKALANLDRAGFAGKVHVERRSVDSLVPPPAARGREGLVAVNPPYGERLGEVQELKGLYGTLGRELRARFPGWRAVVFTGNPELGKEMGIRAVKTNNLYNGDLKCRLLHFDIQPDRFVEPGRGPVPGHDAKGEALMFANRLRKNIRTVGKWAEREGITCYRLYDADIPEFNVAVDMYEGEVHLQEYEAPDGIDPDRAAARLAAARDAVGDVLGVSPDRVHLKVRRRQRGVSQYGKMGQEGKFIQVREGGLSFQVNLTDYIDTGLFLDHRITRAMIQKMASGVDFLNLFCYTGSATVYAAAGGAAATTSVDLSSTYLDWARHNMKLNGFTGSGHRFVRGDVLKWIAQEKGRYGLIFLDPPSYSRSKGMEGDFDIQRDHGILVRQAARLLSAGGILIFSTNRRKFELDTDTLKDLYVEDITDRTIPRDFRKRRQLIHRCFEIRTQNTERGTQKKG
ncbi:MAG: bifunctional 23S rRNA (guanine(2069)-N(7))-methyltransferase RlmK/23S rRNA (guanine(2445)-N(2))-methyltransferase RlmL [bacterium]|nr:bifunctional 23S rRNA (guanine(2069)-N(7))-methyltransferase RlmK/23S rRNA (guanine(2445)-N(2))-methyltransferase RlmL [bacterium]